MTNVEDLVPFLRYVLKDIDSEDYEYSDDELVKYIRMAVQIVEAGWDMGYAIHVEEFSEETIYYIEPEPPVWRQMLYVLKTAMMIKSFDETFLYQTPLLKITKTSKIEDIAYLQQMYDDIEYEHRFTAVGEVWGTWDDFLTRISRIRDKVSEART